MDSREKKWICKKCKKEVVLTQRIQGWYIIDGFDEKGNVELGRYGDDMDFEEYRCDNCGASSWDYRNLIEEKLK